MTSKTIYIVMSLIIAVSVLTVSCAADDTGTQPGKNNAGEAEYKDMAGKYHGMLTEFEKVRPDIITDPDEVAAHLREDGVSEDKIKESIDKGETYTDDFPVFVYYKSKSQEWVQIAKDLSGFRDKYPDSRWSDDTLFLETLLPYLPGRSIETNTYIKDTLRVFATSEVGLSIEPWTMETFKDLNTVKTITRDDVTLLPPGTQFEKKCEALYRFSYAIIAIAEGRKEEGMRHLHAIEEVYAGSALAKIAHNELAKLKGEEG